MASAERSSESAHTRSREPTKEWPEEAEHILVILLWVCIKQENPQPDPFLPVEAPPLYSWSLFSFVFLCFSLFFIVFPCSSLFFFVFLCFSLFFQGGFTTFTFLHFFHVSIFSFFPLLFPFFSPVFPFFLILFLFFLLGAVGENA